MWEAILAVQVGLYISVCVVAGLELRRTLTLLNFRRCLSSRRGLRFLPLAGWAEAFAQTDEGDFDVALLEVTRRTTERLVAPLGWLRLLALVSSALGFAAVAYHFSWLHQDHGLADLDPASVTRLAAQRSAIAVSIAVGTSATSVALRASLRERTRGMVAGLHSLGRVARSGWTAPHAK